MFAKGNTAIDGLSGRGNGAGSGDRRRDARSGVQSGSGTPSPAAAVAHLIAHHPADADPARFGQGFEPRRDVDAVAVNVALVPDDVVEIDADTELAIRRAFGTSLLRAAIPSCTSTAHRTASTTL
jgi:hypothetical protein